MLRPLCLSIAFFTLLMVPLPASCADTEAGGIRRFLDGHVKRVTEGEWHKLRVAPHVPDPGK